MHENSARTHKSLLSVASDRFTNWHVVIDEIPSIFALETQSTEFSVSTLEKYFDLTRIVETATATVTLNRTAKLSRGGIGRDVFLCGLLTFYDRVRSPHNAVTVNIQDWSQAAAEGAWWSWWSVWNIAELCGYASVTVMGNNFEKSVFHSLATVTNPSIVWNEIETPNNRVFAPRTMTINYFAETHRASASLFASA